MIEYRHEFHANGDFMQKFEDILYDNLKFIHDNGLLSCLMTSALWWTQENTYLYILSYFFHCQIESRSLCRSLYRKQKEILSITLDNLMVKLELSFHQARELSAEGFRDPCLNLAKPAVCRPAGDLSVFFRKVARAWVTGVGFAIQCLHLFTIFFSLQSPLDFKGQEYVNFQNAFSWHFCFNLQFLFFFPNESLEFLSSIFLSSLAFPGCTLRIVTLLVMDRLSITHGDTQLPFYAAAFGIFH